jgi:hypothetical protein
MPYVYLVQCSYFKEDVFKIGGSEKIENDRLKSYGKGTKILAMVVVTGDFHHVENQIKVSFNSKFTLIHGNEYFQGNEDEIKLEFLKIVYNHQMTNSQKMTVVSKVDTVKDTVVESKVEGDDTLKQFINDKIQIVRNIDYEKLNCSDKQLNRTKKCVLLELYIDYIKNNSTTINKIKKTEFYNKIKEQFKIEMMKSNGIRYYLCKYKIEEVKNDIVVESEVDTVVNETEVKSYINEVDIQGQFVDERIEIISKENYEQTPKLQKCNKRMKKEALYGLFVSYAIEQGVRIKISKIDFHKGLSKHNIETITCQGFPFYLCSEKVFKSDPEVVTIVNDTEVESEVVTIVNDTEVVTIVNDTEVVTIVNDTEVEYEVDTIVNDTEVDTTESLMKLAKTELQERCKKAGFCSSGIKNDLVKYLTNISKVDTVNNIVIESKTVIPINDIVVECKTDSTVKETVVDIVVESEVDIVAESEVDIVAESEVDIVIEFEKRDENVILQRGRHRVIPNLQGETDIAREQRLNRVYVQKFRNKIRTERGLPPPKKYDKTMICGESEIDREKRLNRERVNRFRESKKAIHNNSKSINDTVVESKVDTIVKDYVVESKAVSIKETVVQSKVIPTKQFIYQNKEIVEVQLGKLVHSKYIRERNGMIYKRNTRVVHYSEPTLSYHPTACVQAHITEEQMHEYNTEHNLTAKYDGDTNSICIFCLQLCVGRGYSNRYEMIQGCYKGNEDDIRVLYACDKCAHWDNDRLFNERQLLKMPDGKEFIIDCIHRVND